MRQGLATWAALLGLLAVGCDGEREGDEPGECEDGADNDGDRYFDCADSDCFGAPACAGDDDDDDDDDGADDDDSGADDDDATGDDDDAGDDDDDDDDDDAVGDDDDDDDDDDAVGDDDDATGPTSLVGVCNNLDGFEDFTALWIRPTGGAWEPEVLQGQNVAWYGCANLNLPFGTFDVFVEDDASFWYGYPSWTITGPIEWWVEYADETSAPF